MTSVCNSARFPLGPSPVLRGHEVTVQLCKKDCLEILNEFRFLRWCSQSSSLCLKEGKEIILFERVDLEHVEEWRQAIPSRD